MLLKKPKQFSKYLGYFYAKICHHELYKIAQSCLTGFDPQNKNELLKTC